MKNSIFIKPNWSHFKSYAIGETLFMTLFVVVYGLCNYYASSLPQDQLYSLFITSETHIPFIPESILIYRTLDVLLFLVLFTVKPQYLKSYFKVMILTLFIAALFFFFFPTKLGFPWPKEVTEFKLLYDVLYSLDKPHNLVPSLHVTYTFITLFVMNKSIGRHTAVLCVSILWLILMCASVVFTHQHHLLDIVTGLALGGLGIKVFNYLVEKEKR